MVILTLATLLLIEKHRRNIRPCAYEPYIKHSAYRQGCLYAGECGSRSLTQVLKIQEVQSTGR